MIEAEKKEKKALKAMTEQEIIDKNKEWAELYGSLKISQRDVS